MIYYYTHDTHLGHDPLLNILGDAFEHVWYTFSIVSSILIATRVYTLDFRSKVMFEILYWRFHQHARVLDKT